MKTSATFACAGTGVLRSGGKALGSQPIKKEKKKEKKKKDTYKQKLGGVARE